jgi:hypothetical protein
VSPHLTPLLLIKSSKLVVVADLSVLVIITTFPLPVSFQSSASTVPHTYSHYLLFPGGNILCLFWRWGLVPVANMQGTVTKDNKKDVMLIYRLYMVNDFPK